MNSKKFMYFNVVKLCNKIEILFYTQIQCVDCFITFFELRIKTFTEKKNLNKFQYAIFIIFMINNRIFIINHGLSKTFEELRVIYFFTVC